MKHTDIVTTLAGRRVRIPMKDIVYFKADQKYVMAKTLEREVLLTASLQSLEVEGGELFLRIHRNAIMAKAALVKFSKTKEGQAMVRLTDGSLLQVSRRHASTVNKFAKSRGAV